MEGRAVDKDKFTYCMEPFKVTTEIHQKVEIKHTHKARKREKRLGIPHPSPLL